MGEDFFQPDKRRRLLEGHGHALRFVGIKLEEVVGGVKRDSGEIEDEAMLEDRRLEGDLGGFWRCHFDRRARFLRLWQG